MPKEKRWKSWILVLSLLGILLVSACSSGGGATSRAWTPPADWVQINAQGHFTFWIPSTLIEERVQGADSYVGQWSGVGLYVKFDFGMYSGGIDSRIKALPHTEVSDNASGRAGTIVTYTDDSAHIATFYVPQVNEQDRLTFTASGSSAGTLDIPLAIVKSVRFM